MLWTASLSPHGKPERSVVNTWLVGSSSRLQACHAGSTHPDAKMSFVTLVLYVCHTQKLSKIIGFM